MIIAIILALALPLAAKDMNFVKRVDPSKLYAELTAAGFTVTNLNCINGTQCRLGVAEGKDPSPVVSAHVYADPRSAKQAELKALEALAKKVEDGTASQQDRDRLLLALIKKYMAGMR